MYPGDPSRSLPGYVKPLFRVVKQLCEEGSNFRSVTSLTTVYSFNDIYVLQFRTKTKGLRKTYDEVRAGVYFVNRT